MKPHEPRGMTVRDPIYLQKHAAELLGKSISKAWRLKTTTNEGSITLLDTLVLEGKQGYTTLTHSQEGLSCQAVTQRTAIRWSVEPDVHWGKHEEKEEWLELTGLEETARIPELPLYVTSVTGWLASGGHDELLALILAGGNHQSITIMTTNQFDLLCAHPGEAAQRASMVTTNMKLVRERLATAPA